MLNCKQVSELVSQSMDRPLNWLERWRLGIHLKVCEGCRNFQKHVTVLRMAFRNHPVIKDSEDE
jgi:predicted anti-sigma-YlaC factor YlaD